MKKTKEDIRRLIKEYGNAEWTAGVQGQMFNEHPGDVRYKKHFDRACEERDKAVKALHEALEL